MSTTTAIRHTLPRPWHPDTQMKASDGPAAATPDELHNKVASLLNRSRQRYTTGRRRLVEALWNAARPVTIREVTHLLPGLAQSSTYRNLDVLERCGVVRRLAVATDHTHFELAEPLLDHHHHLICVGCGTVSDIQFDHELEEMVDRNLSDVAHEAGFTPLHHSLDLHGRCADCETTQMEGRFA